MAKMGGGKAVTRGKSGNSGTGPGVGRMPMQPGQDGMPGTAPYTRAGMGAGGTVGRPGTGLGNVIGSPRATPAAIGGPIPGAMPPDQMAVGAAKRRAPVTIKRR